MNILNVRFFVTLISFFLLSSCLISKKLSKTTIIFDPEKYIVYRDVFSLGVPNDLIFIGSRDTTAYKSLMINEKPSKTEHSYFSIDGFSASDGFFISVEGDHLDSSSFNKDNALMFEVVSSNKEYDFKKQYSLKLKLDHNNKPKKLNYVEFSTVANKPVVQNSFTVRYIPETRSIHVIPLSPLKSGATYMVVLTDGVKNVNGGHLHPSKYFKEIVSKKVFYDSGDDFTDAVGNIILKQSSFLKSHVDMDYNPVFFATFTVKNKNKSVFLAANKIYKENASSIFKKDGYYVFRTPSFIHHGPLRNYKSLPCTLASKKDLAYCTDLAKIYWSASNTSPEILENVYLESNQEDRNDLFESFNKCAGKQKSKNSNINSFIGDYRNMVASGSLQNCDLKVRNEPIDPFKHLTNINPYPLSYGSIDIPINYNKFTSKLGKREAVILMHGLSGTKDSTNMLASILNANGYDTYAIDLPFHGRRLEEYFPEEKKIKGNKNSIFAFMNLVNEMSIRDNINQSIIDHISLSFAINKLRDNKGLLYDKVHLVSLSLGSMIGVGVNSYFASLGRSGDYSISQIDKFIHFAPGLSSPWFLFNSKSYGGMLEEFVKKSSDVLDDKWLVQKDVLISKFIHYSSNIVDPVDSVGSISAIAGSPNEEKTLIVEMKNDPVIPNKIDFNKVHYHPLAGTEPIRYILQKSMFKVVEGQHSYMTNKSSQAANIYILPFLTRM